MRSLLAKALCAPLAVVGACYGVAVVAFLFVAFVIEEDL